MKPVITPISIPQARQLRPSDYLIQRKSDGCHVSPTHPSLPGLTFNGERMRDGSIRINDVMLDADTRERWAELARLAARFPAHWQLEKADVDLAEEIAQGGEDVVLKPWHTAFGVAWLKAKRSENFLVRVVAFNGSSQSVFIEDAITGEPRGKVSLFGGKCDHIRARADGAGSILKLTGYGLTARGHIREARPDHDTPDSWLVQY